MAFIIDNHSEISQQLGHMSAFKKKFKEFMAKVHIAKFHNIGFKCNIEYFDILINLYVKTKNDPRFSIAIVVLDRGLEFRCYLGKIYSVGIKNSDIIGWKLENDDDNSNWFLTIHTHTNMEENKEPIIFFVKNQNLPLVRDFFSKYGFKEL